MDESHIAQDLVSELPQIIDFSLEQKMAGVDLFLPRAAMRSLPALADTDPDSAALLHTLTEQQNSAKMELMVRPNSHHMNASNCAYSPAAPRPMHSRSKLLARRVASTGATREMEKGVPSSGGGWR
jgi:hypothetical protein